MLPRVLERWQASISTGESFDMELPLKGADGIFYRETLAEQQEQRPNQRFKATRRVLF